MPVAQNEMPCRLQGDINDAARFLAALEDLQELGLMNNEVRAFGRPLCHTQQAGRCWDRTSEISPCPFPVLLTATGRAAGGGCVQPGPGNRGDAAAERDGAQGQAATLPV